MKKLDIYIIKSFLKPFFATFLVILFVLVMQAIWMGFDKISGKGIYLGFILKFVGYLALTMVPLAMPIGILLSSIMSIGAFAENYEFAAVKSAGISLRRFITPLFFVTIFLSGINFVFLNYIYPEAMFKQRNMFVNMQKTQPALALLPDVFNTEIPGYTIKFDEKYGKKQNLLKNVKIFDLTKNVGKTTVITAKHGEIESEDDSRYITFKLFDGEYFEEHGFSSNENKSKREKIQASKAKFQSYSINIDIGLFGSDNLNDEKLTNHPQMFSLKQLDSISSIKKTKYHNYVKERALNLFINLGGSYLKEERNSDKKIVLNDTILKNFNHRTQFNILSKATKNTNVIVKEFTSSISSDSKFKINRTILNLFEHEYHSRIAFSFTCLVLFFIGAPLGSIIRKGGFGLPMVLAIVIFVIYFFISTFGKNLAEESAITSTLGAWLSTIILLPFGIMLTRRAAKDKGIFNFKTAFEPIRKLFIKFNFKKKR